MRAAEILGLIVGTIVGTLVFVIALSLILGVIVWLLWPYSGVVLGLPALSLLESMALVMVCSILFKSTPPTSTKDK